MIDDGLWEHYGTLATTTNNSEYVCQTICHSESTAVTSIGHKTSQDYVLAGCHCIARFARQPVPYLCLICIGVPKHRSCPMTWMAILLLSAPASSMEWVVRTTVLRWLIHFPWKKYEQTYIDMNCISVPCIFLSLRTILKAFPFSGAIHTIRI